MKMYMSEHAYVRAWSRMATRQIYINSKFQLMQMFQAAMNRSTYFPFAKKPRSYRCVDSQLVYIFYADDKHGGLALATVYPIPKTRAA